MPRYTLLIFTCSITLLPALLGAAPMDPSVRNDFFAGFAGSPAALDRALQGTEKTLATDPNEAESLAWHGAGLLYLAGQKLSAGDYGAGGQLWDKGMKEMDAAGRIAPDNLSVLVPRAAAWFAASRGVPAGQSKPILERAVADYQHIYDMQRAYFDTLGNHRRSELLFGLADGNARLGNTDLAHTYFEKLAAVGPEGGHFAQANDYLKTGIYEVHGIGCVGCHAGK